MATATLTSKGQITIPAIVRTSLGVEAGDRVEFVEVEPGRFELVAATQSVIALKKVWGQVLQINISKIHFLSPHIRDGR